MAVENGISMTCSLDDSADSLRDISQDVVSLDFETSVNHEEIQGLTDVAMERLLLLQDSTATLTTKFDDTSGAFAFAVLKDAHSTNQIRDLTIALSGQTYNANVHIPSVGYSRAADGSFTLTASLVNGDGSAPVWT